jgi:hypothetical protein
MSDFLFDLVNDFYRRKKDATSRFGTDPGQDSMVSSQLNHALLYINDPLNSPDMLIGHVAKPLVADLIGKCLASTTTPTIITPSPAAFDYKPNGADYVFLKSDTVRGFGQCTMQDRANRKPKIEGYPGKPYMNITSNLHQISTNTILMLLENNADETWKTKCSILRPGLMKLLSRVL